MAEIWAEIRAKRRQLLAGLLAVAMLLQLVPFAALKAWAANTIYDDYYYIDRDDNRVWAEDAQRVTTTDKNWTSGTYIVTSDDGAEVTIKNRVTVTGNVILILADRGALEVPKGITVGEGSTLVIYGQKLSTGNLTAGGSETMAEGAAGIGGGANTNGGTVEINGGVVTATGGKYGAGIGGGQNASGGTVTIRGADTVVRAIGYTGIGGGENGAAGTITIEDGTVTATGKEKNGIGTGAENDASPEGSCVTIRGGEVTACSNNNGAGINANTVTIQAGTVSAAGVYTNTGIEGATVEISGGTVTATGSKTGAGIDADDFTTGTNGHAFIVASSISDNTDTDNWSGVIFQGADGYVYGSMSTSPLMLPQSGTVPSNATLHIAYGETLQLGENVQLSVKGKLDNQGMIVLWPGACVTGKNDKAIEDEAIVEQAVAGNNTLSGSVGAGEEIESNDSVGAGAEKANNSGVLVAALLLGGGIAAGTAVYFYVRAQRAAAKAKEAETAAQAPEAASEAALEAAQEAAPTDEVPTETAEAETEAQAADATA
jgi:hypothetical protein